MNERYKAHPLLDILDQNHTQTIFHSINLNYILINYIRFVFYKKIYIAFERVSENALYIKVNLGKENLRQKAIYQNR